MISSGGSGGGPLVANVANLKMGVDLRADVMMPDGDSTITFWHKGYSNGSYGHGIFGWKDLGVGGTRFCYLFSKSTWRYATGEWETEWNIGSYFPVSWYTDQTWRFVALRRSGSNFSIFMNGNTIFTATSSLPHANDTTPLSIGSMGTDNSSSSSASRGQKAICSFGIYSQALDDQTLYTAMITGMPINNANCIAFWPLTETTQLQPAVGNQALTAYTYSGNTLTFDQPIDVTQIIS